MRTPLYVIMMASAFMLALRLAMGSSMPALADEKDKVDNVAESLDDELLRELQEDLLDDGQADAPPDKTATQGPAEPADVDIRQDDKVKVKSRLDKQLERELGEDVGLGPEEDPLSRIARLMRRAEERTAKADASEQTRRLQEQIVDDLDRLIKQARRRQQQKQSGSGGGGARQTGSKRSQASQPPKSAQQGGQRPSRNSTNRVGRADARQVDMAQMKDMLKDLWGQLPAKTREEMINSLGEQFLPKYEVQIEKYFKRLAEEPNLRETGR